MGSDLPADLGHGAGLAVRRPGKLVDREAALQELVNLMEVDAAACEQLADVLVDPKVVAKGALLFRQGTSTHSIYFVRSGTFKVYQVDQDGYEQVLRFPMRGEMLGFDSVCEDRHPSSAAALADASVLVVSSAGVWQARQRSSAFDQGMHRLLSRQLLQIVDVTVLMSAVAAEVRLARFLCQLAARVADIGSSAAHLQLCMSRRDIASYLGLANETVSRCLKLLADHGLINVRRREIEIVDPVGLREAARFTRRGSGAQPASLGSSVRDRAAEDPH